MHTQIKVRHFLMVLLFNICFQLQLQAGFFPLQAHHQLVGFEIVNIASFLVFPISLCGFCLTMLP